MGRAHGLLRAAIGPEPGRGRNGGRRLFSAALATPSRLRDRARAAGIETHILWTVTNDFNADLRRFGADALLTRLQAQLTPEDAARFASGGTQPVAAA